MMHCMYIFYCYKKNAIRMYRNTRVMNTGTENRME